MKGDIYMAAGILFVLFVAGGIYALNYLSPATSPANATIETSTSMGTFVLKSTAFANGGSIPSRYTCDGDATRSPPLTIWDPPKGTRSLVLIMDDPDVPKVVRPDAVFDHWVLFNISPGTTEIQEGGTIGTRGANSAGKNVYTGPCPPPQFQPPEHRYFFKLYALDTMLPLQAGASKSDVEKAMQGHVIESTELMGRYSRQ